MINVPRREVFAGAEQGRRRFVPGLAFNTSEQAWAELHDHAITLKRLGLAGEFGVSVDRLEGQPGWGIYIREYAEDEQV